MALDSPTHLLYRAHQIAAEFFAVGADPSSLTLRQYALLSAIAAKSAASQTDLVRMTGIDRSTLAEMIARLETRGLIDRTRVTKDGRTKSARLTVSGRAALEEARPRAQNADRLVLALLPKGRREAFLETLKRIADAADEDKAKAAKKAARKQKKHRASEAETIPAPPEALQTGKSRAAKKAGKPKKADREPAGPPPMPKTPRSSVRAYVEEIATAFAPEPPPAEAAPSPARNAPAAKPIKTAAGRKTRRKDR